MITISTSRTVPAGPRSARTHSPVEAAKFRSARNRKARVYRRPREVISSSGPLPTDRFPWEWADSFPGILLEHPSLV